MLPKTKHTTPGIEPDGCVGIETSSIAPRAYVEAEGGCCL